MAQHGFDDIYSELGDNKIRIMHLWPGPSIVNPSPGIVNIYVELSSKGLDDRPKHDALSWKWGEEGEKDGEFQIYIRRKLPNETHNPFRPFPVRPNLWWALRRIQKPDREVVLWVDAICINQKDNPEKSRQISMMTEIYGKAEQVIVWLGEPGLGENIDITKKEVQQAVVYIKKFGNLDDHNHIASVHGGILDKAGLLDLEPVFKLFRRGWFSRRWIVQEISMSKEATLMCGGEKLRWDEFAHSVALLETVGRDGSINRMLKTLPGTRHVSDYVGNISALPAYRLIQNASDLREERDGLWREKRTLEQLVCFLAAFKASEAQDTIYAVLGLASDFKPAPAPIEVEAAPAEDEAAPAEDEAAPAEDEAAPAEDEAAPAEDEVDISEDKGTTGDREEFIVNYKDTPLRVFGRFLEAAIAKSKSIDILCRPWAPFEQVSKDRKVKNIPLPSWIQSLRRKPFQPDENGKMYRYNADPLVGAAIPRLKFYTASGTRPVKRQTRFFKVIYEDHDSLKIKLKVCYVGTIKEIWDSAVFGNIPASWLGAAKWEKENKLPPPEFWRTMVANRTNEGNYPEPWYPRAFHSAVREKGIRHGINTHQLIHEKENAAYFEVFRRVQAVVWNRRLIKVEREGNTSPEWCRLGLAPEEAKKDDKIYIALGCSVPLVISKVDEESRTHTLIGECYVDGMMDGHAAKGAKWEDLTLA